MNAPAFQMPDWITDHIKLYQTDPEKAHLYDFTPLGGPAGVPTLLLTTKGRKTGRPLPIPLIYSKQGNGFAIIASKGGAPDHPAWYLNLDANPEVEIQVASKHYKARARTVSGPERGKIWADMAKIYPFYDDYQKNAGAREIPVVMLEPQ